MSVLLTTEKKDWRLEHIFIKNINSNISRFLRLIAFCGGEIFSLNYLSVLRTQVQVYLCMWWELILKSTYLENNRWRYQSTLWHNVQEYYTNTYISIHLVTVDMDKISFIWYVISIKNLIYKQNLLNSHATTRHISTKEFDINH